jgi:hypothetical protein
MRAFWLLLALGLLGCDDPLAEWQTDRVAHAGFEALQAGQQAQALEQCRLASRLAPGRADLRVCAALAALGMQRSDLFLEELDGLAATKAFQVYPWLHQAVVYAFLDQRLLPGRLPFARPPAASLDSILHLLLARADLTGPWGAYGEALSREASPAVQEAWSLARGGPLLTSGAAGDCATLTPTPAPSPDDPWLTLDWGVCRWRAGDQTAALEAFAAVQQRRPEILLASFNLALAFARLGRVPQAQASMAALGPALELSETASFVAQALDLFGVTAAPAAPHAPLSPELSARLQGLEEYRSFAP